MKKVENCSKLFTYCYEASYRDLRNDIIYKLDEGDVVESPFGSAKYFDGNNRFYDILGNECDLADLTHRGGVDFTMEIYTNNEL